MTSDLLQQKNQQLFSTISIFPLYCKNFLTSFFLLISLLSAFHGR